MPIYNVIKDTLTEISEIPFELEKNIQYIVEHNIKTIFNIDFVTSEFELNGLRIDSLGFDNDSKSFIIIEYKKDKNFSVIDQGYAYLSLLLNNKAEFILKYNETREKEYFLKKDDVDWSQSRVIFIAPQFTTYQRKAIISFGLSINVKPTAKYIAFIHKKNFVDIVLYKSNLTLFLNMKKGTLNDPKKIARDVSNIGHWGNGDYEIKIKDSSNLSYIISLIRQSYDSN